mmetsp:Transcript_58301/g.160004  ORF Transcript_58301/g.160004 Transcript_58301/m.160004 type:complete len:253 (+) Transcript_58301:308-1066(+)
MLVAWIVSTYRRKKALEAAAVELIQNQVNEGIGIVNQIQAPMVLMKGSDFVKLDGLEQHEALRDRGLLVFVDTVEAFLNLYQKKYITVFFSHQWLAFASPDPEKKQFALMCSAAQQVSRPASSIWASESDPQSQLALYNSNDSCSDPSFTPLCRLLSRSSGPWTMSTCGSMSSLSRSRAAPCSASPSTRFRLSRLSRSISSPSAPQLRTSTQKGRATDTPILSGAGVVQRSCLFGLAMGWTRCTMRTIMRVS